MVIPSPTHSAINIKGLLRAIKMENFDAMAKDYDAETRRVKRAQNVAAAIKQSVRLLPSMTALEYGCGTALLSFALQSSLGSITLADSSEGMINILQGKIAVSGLNHMIPVRLDLSTDPLPSDRYQIIYMLMTLHHISDTAKILRDFHTLLEARGILCIADLDKEDGSYHGPDFSGHPGFDRDELKEDLLSAGFRNVLFKT
jgi:ubiquinone/menaquinone biosynthesis C-methylase UbiE